MGRAGCCRQISLCGGSTPRFPATLGLPRTGVSVLSSSTLLRLPAALYGAGPALSAVPVFGSSTKARVWLRLHFVPSPASAVQSARGLGALTPGAARLFPPQRAARADRDLEPSPRARRAFSLHGPSARRQSGLRKSSDRNRGLFAGWEGVASLGLFAPFPSPCLLPPAGMGRLFSGVSQSLCFANRRRCVPAG